MLDLLFSLIFNFSKSLNVSVYSFLMACLYATIYLTESFHLKLKLISILHHYKPWFDIHFLCIDDFII